MAWTARLYDIGLSQLIFTIVMLCRGDQGFYQPHWLVALFSLSADLSSKKYAD